MKRRSRGRICYLNKFKVPTKKIKKYVTCQPFLPLTVVQQCTKHLTFLSKPNLTSPAWCGAAHFLVTITAPGLLFLPVRNVREKFMGTELQQLVRIEIISTVEKSCITSTKIKPNLLVIIGYRYNRYRCLYLRASTKTFN